MTVNYEPKFRHVDWVDNVDRVRAAGDNGFNDRFHSLEKEFDLIAGVVDDVGRELDRLGRAPTAQEVNLTLAPTLTTLGDRWDHVFGGAVKPPAATQASGFMAVQLPHGVTILRLAIFGRKDSGNLEVGLRRQSIATGAATELIVSVSAPNGPFTGPPKGAPAGAISRVDNDQFRYYLTAELDTAPGNAVVQLNAFQITHIAS
jgi:hypothetical protein